MAEWRARAKRVLAAGLAAGLGAGLGACTTSGLGRTSFGEEPAAADAGVLGQAKAQFAAGDYGLAARSYEQAVEGAPNDAEAWLGLAAAYDRVRRFDLADRAYREVGRLIGERAEYHNNLGYSYWLRGEPDKARPHLLRAQALDPTSPTVSNNLQILNHTPTADQNG